MEMSEVIDEPGPEEEDVEAESDDEPDADDDSDFEGHLFQRR
jgi:hypothetical protein